MKKKQPKGQIGLILLVIMGLVVGIALSLASRSLSDTVLSRQESESSKAFRLAETGIEQALNALRNNEVLSGVTLSGGSAFTGSVNVAGQTTYDLYVKEGEQAHLDVESFSGPLSISWTKHADSRENPGSCNEGSGNSPAAIEVLRLNTVNTASFAYYNSVGCGLGNGFEDSNVGGNDPYLSQVTINVPAGSKYVRIRPIYSDATIEVSGTNLGTQLYLIQSKAEGGDAKKEIEVKRGLSAASSVFDYALFSGGSIEK